ncbi:MAG: ATPase, T2SS/T4P/T4SS family [Mariprofundus sp.]|nr:ATPase, T2SS/T4P/T4SS family [Mariprofundus sp.]
MHLKYQRQLICTGVLTEAQLTAAEMGALANKKSLLAALLDIESVDDALLLHALAKLYKAPYVDIRNCTIDSELMALCPHALCLEHTFVPISKSETDLTIATARPVDVDMLDTLAFKLGKHIIPHLAHPDHLMAKINDLDTQQDHLFGETVNALHDQELLYAAHDEDESVDLEALKRGADESPIIKLVNGLIMHAMEVGSSDIHIEPADKQSVVRLRVDGLLHPMIHFPSQYHSSVVSRIKIMSKLDISNTRTPQDGRIHVNLQKNHFDMRISTLPAMHGEKVVMRILDQGGVALDLDALNFGSLAYQRIVKSIGQPSGAILVTGPTGSGKTTTLYSFLEHIKNEQMNLITIEDPVEFQIEGINQVQVNSKSGLGFSAILRSILRQDPDVVMVGEVRDEETAEIALHAAQTGHLVLSTLHTNDACSTVTRLLDMGIQATMLASSLNLIVAQRLVRRLCPKCCVKSAPSEALSLRLAIPKELVFYAKVGCEHCLNIGYKGRMGIHEVLYLSDHLRQLVAAGTLDSALMQAAREEGMFTLFEDGMAKAMSGQTTLEEVLRVCVQPEGFQLCDYLGENQQLLSYSERQQFRTSVQAERFEVAAQQTILAVDRSPVMRELVKFLLEAKGFNVLLAEDGQQAQRILQTVKPVLLLMDSDLVNMRAIELLTQLRRDDAFNRMAIMFLSTPQGEADEALAFQHGADDYMIKPVEPLILQLRVVNMIRLYQPLD